MSHQHLNKCSLLLSKLENHTHKTSFHLMILSEMVFKCKFYLFFSSTIIKMSFSGSVINGALTTTTHTNINLEETSNNLDDGQDIGVIGKGIFKLKK